MIQHSLFLNGGFVLHRCLRKRLSAWYDKDGSLLDHELVDRIGRSRKASVQDVAELRRLGKLYRKEPK